MNSGMYKITNIIDGKIYIGQSINIQARFAEHRHLGRIGKDRYLYRAMQKHGIENFTFEILFIADDLDYLNDMEIKLIEVYDCQAPKGYNLLPGGKNARHTDETKKTISEKRKGKGRWPEGKIPPHLGYKQTDYQKSRVTEANMKKWKIITPEGEQFIIENLRQWARENRLDQANLSRGGNGSHKGYKATRID